MLTKRDIVARWVSQTPEGCNFAVKASRYLTHVKRPTDLTTGVEQFYAPLEPLRESGRLGPVLWRRLHGRPRGSYGPYADGSYTATLQRARENPRAAGTHLPSSLSPARVLANHHLG